MAAWARRGPARGPVGNSVVSLPGPAGSVEGTRTEAAQKVPQAKPEWAAPSGSPLDVVRVVVAPMASWAPGDEGMPR